MSNFMRSLLAVLLGNLIYFWLLPKLPYALQHRSFAIDLGLVLDAIICLGLYGLISWLARSRGERARLSP